MRFKYYKQHDSSDCGPACLKMIAETYGRDVPLAQIRDQCFITRHGINMLGISEAAEKLDFRTLAVKVELQKLASDAPLPCILHWNQNHFVVLYRIRRDNFYVADPGHGLLRLDRKDLEKNWLDSRQEGIALLLEPTQQFYSDETGPGKKQPATGKLRVLYRYLSPYKKYLFQLLLCMVFAVAIAFVTPFFMQRLVDDGINQRDIGFVKLVLTAQILLFLGSLSIEFIRNWLLLYLNSRVNITIISDFLAKLMRLPIGFFDSRMVGDIRQRINDHSRIQAFLTGSSLSTLFSLINVVAFAIVLGFFKLNILIIYLSFTAAGFVWIALFQHRRRVLDYKRFKQSGENESVLLELITGMQEIKMNNCETYKRWDWERIQGKIYKISLEGLKIGQYQQLGMSLLEQSKNISVSYISAVAVIHGNMTLGMMMSVSFIIGQMNAPFQQLIGFIQSAQDARISLDRLNEIHEKDDEDQDLPQSGGSLVSGRNGPGAAREISVDRLSYQYTGKHAPFVLKDVSFSIPMGKTTAIVGESGSGKTTLMKLLLKFYEPSDGVIRVGGTDMRHISSRYWRSKCGAVMQDGSIFSDSIAENISLSDDSVDVERLKQVCEVVNLTSFIDDLPMGYHTKIGMAGSGLSGGQRQRVLIARAIYKNPDFIFLDEATSALDANNEKAIASNLSDFYKGKTAVVIAHRLSTVMNADQIIVLERGRIVETGTHSELVGLRGQYYELVKNQLQLSL